MQGNYDLSSNHNMSPSGSISHSVIIWWPDLLSANQNYVGICWGFYKDKCCLHHGLEQGHQWHALQKGVMPEGIIWQLKCWWPNSVTSLPNPLCPCWLKKETGGRLLGQGTREKRDFTSYLAQCELTTMDWNRLLPHLLCMHALVESNMIMRGPLPHSHWKAKGWFTASPLHPTPPTPPYLPGEQSMDLHPHNVWVQGHVSIETSGASVFLPWSKKGIGGKVGHVAVGADYWSWVLQLLHLYPNVHVMSGPFTQSVQSVQLKQHLWGISNVHAWGLDCLTWLLLTAWQIVDHWICQMLAYQDLSQI